MQYQYFQDRKGEWRWHLRASGNHKIIACSAEGYRALNDCLAAIRLVQRGNLLTPVVQVAGPPYLAGIMG